MVKTLFDSFTQNKMKNRRFYPRRQQHIVWKKKPACIQSHEAHSLNYFVEVKCNICTSDKGTLALILKGKRITNLFDLLLLQDFLVRYQLHHCWQYILLIFSKPVGIWGETYVIIVCDTYPLELSRVFPDWIRAANKRLKLFRVIRHTIIVLWTKLLEYLA